ncbi:OB-fold protein [Pontimicrobium sp. MEBiC06410]
MKKLYWIILLIAVIGGYLGYSYIYQDHRDIDAEKPEFIVTSDAIAKEFAEDATTAETKYLNKTIMVSGNITEVNAKDLTINNTLFCNLSKGNETTKFKINDNITIKGRCIGYDDLLEQVKLDQCSIKN